MKRLRKFEDVIFDFFLIISPTVSVSILFIFQIFFPFLLSFCLILFWWIEADKKTQVKTQVITKQARYFTIRSTRKRRRERSNLNQDKEIFVVGFVALKRCQIQFFHFTTQILRGKIAVISRQVLYLARLCQNFQEVIYEKGP